MKVLVLMHRDLIPPTQVKKSEIDRISTPWLAEFDVTTELQKMGHTVEPLGVVSDLTRIRSMVEIFKPNIVFNLLEEFNGEAVFDQNVVSYLELLKIPYTGCNPRGLMIARDKALSKKILAYHKIGAPKFCVFSRSKPRKKPKHLLFPLIVKSLTEEASLGIANSSVVNSEEKLYERVEYINKSLGTDAIAEEFIEGKEYYVGVYGNHRLKTLPPWKLEFKNSSHPERELYSEKAKFDRKYREKKGVNTGPANLSTDLQQKLSHYAKKTYSALSLSGYARIDFRISTEGKIYVLEANPNPDISRDDEFSLSAKHEKMSYHEVLSKIISLGKSWNPTEGITCYEL